MALAPGTRIGHYDITSLLGEGGMGQVWQATDTQLSRGVALKILPDAFAADPERLARFKREAQILASLNHPNIAAIYGIEEAPSTRAPSTDGDAERSHGSGQAIKALVLELVEGPTLADRIRQGPIPLDEALPIAKQIAEALEAAHEAGVIHRDLKPANIKVKDDGTVKVLDFGLAKAFQPEASGTSASMSPTISLTAAATQIGMVIGTAAYMSPEQAKGKVVDKRADVWAFGCVLFEMLVGKRAFGGGDVSETLAYVITRDVDWAALPEGTSQALRHVLRRCLERDPKRRLRDIGDARLDLEDRQAFGTTDQPAAVAAPRPQVWQRPVALVATGLISAVVGGLVVWSLARPTTSPVVRAMITPPATRPLAFTTDTSIALTPDGSRVVYLARSENGLSVFVRPLAALEATSVLDLGGNPRRPFVSPDGAWLGFFAGGRSLQKVTIRGGPPITICELPSGLSRGASWGQDDTIIFATGGVGGLWQVPAGGGEPEQLTTPDPERGEANHVFPDILPGGKAVLFSITPAGGSFDEAQIAVLSLETRLYEVLIPGGTSPRYVSSGHIVYAAGGTLRAVGFDVNRLEVTTDPIPVVDTVRQSGISGAAEFAVADNGTLVYVRGTGGGAGVELAWVDRNGREEPLAADAGVYMGPKLSPDGARLALEIEDEDSRDLFIYDLGRDNFSQLTFSPQGNCCAVWSPDGERIVFTSNRDGAPNLYLKNADGTGDEERLTNSRRTNISFAWSADGKTVLFIGEGDLHRLEMEGEHTTTRLFETPFTELHAALSRDGRWLAYQSNEGGDFNIYVRPFPDVDTGIWKVSASGGRFPVWSPDGRELFFVEGDAVMASVITAGATFSWESPTVLFQGPYVLSGELFTRVFDVSPDGRFLMRKPAGTASSEGAVAPELIAVFNWFEELKAQVPVP